MLEVEKEKFVLTLLADERCYWVRGPFSITKKTVLGWINLKYFSNTC